MCRKAKIQTKREAASGGEGISRPPRQDLAIEYYAEIQDLPQRLPDGLAGSLDQLVV